MDRSNIRVKAFAVFRRGHEILVNAVAESDGTVKGYRVPGGHVEFNERAIDTLHREIREELNTGIDNVRFIHVMENMFVYNGQPGHEVIFLYEAEFTDQSFYARETMEAREDNGTTFTLFWLDPRNPPEGTEIYPTGVVNYLS